MFPPKHHLSGNGTAKPPPEKSKFAQTCNRLSLFLKEKRNIRDLNAKLDDATGVLITPATATTVDLLSNIDEKASSSSSQVEKNNSNSLPEYVILDSSCFVTANIEQVAKKPKKSGQMTIFYQGQVVVLDEVPADRARDMMLMAKQKDLNRVETSKLESAVVEVVQQKAKDSDLPIARRASLHKFLAKRKDRATVRAPYPNNNNNNSPGASSSGNEHTFDLNM